RRVASIQPRWAVPMTVAMAHPVRSRPVGEERAWTRRGNLSKLRASFSGRMGLPRLVKRTVTNRGNPIPPEKLALIFEKFYRLDQARSSQTGGAGLGLAIAKEIVAAHGGTIEATSDEEETVVTVTLP